MTSKELAELTGSSEDLYRFKAPELPPVSPATPDPGAHTGNYLWQHYDDVLHSYRNEDSLEPFPPPLQDVVTPENPLEVSVYYSMRSPYSYLSLPRYLWINSNYNVDVTIKVIFPVAVRTPGMFGGGMGGTEEAHPKKGGRWYKWGDAVHDTARVGKYEGVPFRFAYPDPIVQNHWPLDDQGDEWGHIAPLDKQPWIAWLVRLGAAAQLAGKSNEYVWAVSPLIWGGQSDYWPEDVEGAVNGIGMDYAATIKDIQANPDKYDAVWSKNQDEMTASGHGGVPNGVFRGEPFFGQDRVDILFWRLRQNGLTTRPEPKPPIVAKPLRWSD
jgi:2-hydroxychromene-2-carboxylate isomerase